MIDVLLHVTTCYPHSRFLKKVYINQVVVDDMGRAFWWISTGIMLVVFMPVGILLLGITLIKEICNIFNDDVEEVKVKKKSKKKFKSKDYSEEVLSEYR